MNNETLTLRRIAEKPNSKKPELALLLFRLFGLYGVQRNCKLKEKKNLPYGTK